MRFAENSPKGAEQAAGANLVLVLGVYSYRSAGVRF
jgi:hypothetical protein